MANLIDDPSFEYNVAPTSVGTPTSSARSAEQKVTGTYSWKIVTDAANEGIQLTVVTTSGKFYRVGVWVYVVSGTVDLKNFTFQNGISTYARSNVTGKWTRLMAVFRATAASTVLQLISSGAITFYVDEANCVIMDDVTLTVTPASAANSIEGSGIRVDGTDYLLGDLNSAKAALNTSRGDIRFKVTPRYNWSIGNNFGNTRSYLLLMTFTIGNIYVYRDGSNLVVSYFDGSSFFTSTVALPAVFLAGVPVTVRVVYTTSKIECYVNGVLYNTYTGTVTLTGEVTYVRLGSYSAASASVADAVFSPA